MFKVLCIKQHDMEDFKLDLSLLCVVVLYIFQS